jgi:hypothetical protein
MDPTATPPAAPAEQTVDLEQIKTMVDLPATASDVELITVLVNIIASLQEKYEGLLADAVEMEDRVTNRDLADFADVIDEKSLPFWKEQMLTNRAAAVEALTSIREKAAQPEPPPAAPEAEPVRIPLRNRLAPIVRPTFKRVSAEPAASERVNTVAAQIRNRAHEIQKLEKVPFIVAFARAEKQFNKE